MVNGPFTYTPSGKKRAPSKEMVLRWIDRAWSEIAVDLIVRLFKSCGINNALDGTEDDAVWDDEEEDAEDAEEPVDNEFETDSEAENDEKLSSAEHSNKWFFSEPPRFFLEPTNQKKSMINVVCLLFIHLPGFFYIHISV